jgi:hypothetical protein
MNWTPKESSFDGCVDWSQIEGLTDGLDSEKRLFPHGLIGVKWKVGYKV